MFCVVIRIFLLFALFRFIDPSELLWSADRALWGTKDLLSRKHLRFV